MSKKKRNYLKFDNSKNYKDYHEFGNDTFKKMDDGLELPQFTDREQGLTYQMAKDYLELILEENECAKKSKKKSIETLNEMYRLLFKLNMFTFEDEENDNEVEDKKEGEITVASKEETK